VVVGIPGRITHRDGRKVDHKIDLNMTDLPDPVARTLQSLLDRVAELERTIEELRRLLPAAPLASAGERPRHQPGELEGIVRSASPD
jgi:hypothetical protein